MCKHIFIICVIILLINIDLSVQQLLCSFSCNIFDNNNNKYCTNDTRLSANATIVNKVSGVVQLEFQFKCNVEIYNIYLEYTPSRECNNFAPHSEYFYTQTRNNINNTNIADTQFDKCKENGIVLLQNIQTGCYKVEIIDENYYILYTNNLFWDTDYISHIVPLNETKITDDSRNNGTELKLHIENPILNTHPNISLSFKCNKCANITKYTYTYHLIQDEVDKTNLILDAKNNNNNYNYLNISCSLIQNKNKSVNGIADCIIFPINIGSYKIVITFIGDPYKCPPNIPAGNKITVNINVKGDDTITQRPLNASYIGQEKIFGSILAAICFVIAFFAFLLILKFANGKNKEPNVNIDEAELKFENMEYDDESSCSNLLLLYARDSEDVMNTLSSFRNIFLSQGIQVYDIYDPERLKEIHENNYNWILNLTNRDDIKIIIFLTPNGQHFTLAPAHVQDSIDYLYAFAMNHLLQMYQNDRHFYKRISVAYFSNDLDSNYSDYELFTPHLRFRIPDDLKALLQRIHTIQNNEPIV